MQISAYSFFLWLITPIVQTVIIGTMLKTRLYREAPIFFSYTLFVIFHQLASYLVYRLWPNYFFAAAWTGEVISIILGLCVIGEVYEQLLEPYEGIHALAFLLLRWCIFVAFAIAIFAGITSPGQDTYRLTVGLMALERSARIVQVCLLLFIFSFAKTLHLSWRHHTFGIALGFSLFAAVSVIGYGVRLELGPDAGEAIRKLIPTTYLVTCLVWCAYLFAPAVQRDSVDSLPDSDLSRWNLTVLELIKR